MAGRIEDQLSYNPITGFFHWIVAKPKIHIGMRAGCVYSRGYRRIKIDGKSYKEHRLAFYFMTGEWPKDQVDHINLIRDDNRWENLRVASNAQNQWNSKPYSSTGFKGVYKVGKKFKVKGHQDKYLGYTDNFELACQMSKEHREKHGEGFARVQ